MKQLQQLAVLDPEAQKLLMEDLAKTDPALWKPLMERFRIALEYHRRLQEGGAASRPGQEDASSKEPGGEKNPAKDSEGASSGSPGEISSGPQGPGTPTEERKGPPGGQTHEAKNPSSSPSGSGLSGAQSGNTSSGGHRGAENSQIPHDRRLPPLTPQGAVSEGPMQSFPGLSSRTASSGPTVSAASVGESSTEPAGNSAVSPTGTPPSTLQEVRQAGANEPICWQERLTVLLRQMQGELSPSPQTDEEISRHVYYRLLCLAAGRREEALQPIPGVPPAMQDFWSNQFYAMHLLLDGQQIADRRERAAEAKRLFNEATAKLAVAAPLTLKGLAFATEVQSFGCYGGFEKYEFVPGQEVLLYAEVENFKSEPTAKGFHTKLRSRYQIFNAEGHPVDEQEFPITEEYCRQLRRDFFIAYPLQLPKDLQPGRYTLKISLEDLHRGELCQASIDFTIRKAKS